MGERILKLVPVLNAQEAQFSMKLYESPIIVVRANQEVVIITDHKWLLWYSDEVFNHISAAVFMNPHITKLVCTPLSKLKQHYGLSECVNCQHINDYVCARGGNELLPEMKQLIMNAHTIRDHTAQRIASIMMLYQEAVDSAPQEKVIQPPPRPPKPKKPPTRTPQTKIVGSMARPQMVFNKKRDCYLQYITVFNDILSSDTEPLTAVELARRADSYPNFCRISMTPLEALEVCVQAQALHYDPVSKLVSLP